MKTHRLVLKCEVPDDVPEAEALKLLGELVQAINAYTKGALGGTGVEVETHEVISDESTGVTFEVETEA